MSDDTIHTRRRTLLSTLAGGVAVGLAGCSGESDDVTATQTPESGVLTTTDAPETNSPTATETPTPGEVSVPDDDSGTVREQVRRVGMAIRRGTVALTLGEHNRLRAAGWVFDHDRVVTAGTPLLDYDAAEVSTYFFERGGQSAAVLGATNDSADVGALHIERPVPRLPIGRSADLEEGQVLVSVGHSNTFGNWYIRFGRFTGWVDDGRRFRSTLPISEWKPGGPTVTLDGEVVGMGVAVEPRDPPDETRPPQTKQPTVYTDKSEWFDVTHEPVEIVVDHLEEWNA